MIAPTFLTWESLVIHMSKSLVVNIYLWHCWWFQIWVSNCLLCYDVMISKILSKSIQGVTISWWKYQCVTKFDLSNPNITSKWTNSEHFSNLFHLTFKVYFMKIIVANCNFLCLRFTVSTPWFTKVAYASEPIKEHNWSLNQELWYARNYVLQRYFYELWYVATEFSDACRVIFLRYLAQS